MNRIARVDGWDGRSESPTRLRELEFVDEHCLVGVLQGRGPSSPRYPYWKIGLIDEEATCNDGKC